MKNSLFAGVCLVALLGVGSANAADLPSRIPSLPIAAPIPFTWTGFYIGGHTGVAVGKSTTRNAAPFDGFDADIPLSYNTNPVGIFGGGQVGYNWQAGMWLLGLEGDFGYLGLSETIYPVPENLVSVKYGWYGTITGRLGLTFDRLLTYVKGGAAVTSVTNTASNFAGGVIDPTDFSESKKTRWGWTVGTGFEYALSPNWSAKAEYMFMNFGTNSATNLEGDRFEHKNQVHTVKVGLNYRFGGYQAPVVARY